MEPDAKSRKQLQARLRFIRGGFTAAFAVIALHLATYPDHSGGLRLKAPPQYKGYSQKRADIVDRNGDVLATNVHTYDLYAHRGNIRDNADFARRLAQVLPGIDADKLTRRLGQSDKGRIRLLRDPIKPRELSRVLDAGIPGIETEPRETRTYPNRNLAAHLLGRVGDEGFGMAGLERDRDQQLRAYPGHPLVLSLDRRVQYFLQAALQKSIDEFSAVGGAGMVMHARTGEILAAVSLPDYDPNLPEPVKPEHVYSEEWPTYNRLVSGTYEMGSTMKLFTMAMAFEENVISMESTFDARKPLYIGGHRISDYHAKRKWQTVPEIFSINSSNIGTVRIVEEIGAEKQQAWLQRFGLLDKVSLEISGISPPQLPPRWGRTASATISFGHGLNINSVQLVRAVAAMVNGGLLVQPTLLKGGSTRAPQRVISRETSDKLRRLLSLCVTHADGTCDNAAAPGYYVGGKTGTAEKINKRSGRYHDDQRTALFVGAFPIYEPQYIVFAMVDEPKPSKKSYGYATGGWVAAPVVGETIQRMAPMLNMPPQDDNDPLLRAQLAIPGYTDEAQKHAAR